MKNAVDILQLNCTMPDHELWICTQYRVGWRTREYMVWLQVSLAQMAALLHPTYKVKIMDTNLESMSWSEFK
jgi:anaerobic magnesium-protoporphyrin IX monomethyl ester cyclase